MRSPIVVMGVSGSGKSTVGAALAQRLLVPFDALSGFFDPSVQFGLKFDLSEAGETPEEAVSRRAPQELGVEVADVAPLLPGFRYRAADAAGV